MTPTPTPTSTMYTPPTPMPWALARTLGGARLALVTLGDMPWLAACCTSFL